VLATAFLGLFLSVQTPPAPVRPADRLLALVPPSAPLVVVLEDLRLHLDRWPNQPYVRSLAELPPVLRWRQSKDWNRLERATAEIEAVVGMSLDELARDVLGDAVVLALDPAPDTGEPRGLLLVKPRSPGRLRQAIDSLNRAERASGSLTGTETLSADGAAYVARRFRVGRAPDFYAILPDDTLAWSNSEPLLRDLLARARSTPPDWLAWLRARLPADALLSVHADIPALAALAGQDGGDLSQARPLLEPFRSIGLALTLHDAIEFHAVERLREGTRLSTPPPGAASRLAARLGTPVIAIAAGGLDVSAVHDLAMTLALEKDPSARPLVDTALAGLLGASDLKGDVLAHLGPGAILAWLPDEAPAASDAAQPPTLLAAIELADRPALRAGLRNAIRAVMALAALDPQRRALGATVESSQLGGQPLLIYRQPGVTLAAAVGDDLLAISNNPARLAAIIEPPPPATGADLETSMAGADQFARVDADALRSWITARRAALASEMAGTRRISIDEAARNLDDAIALLGLLDFAYLTNRIDTADGAIRQRAGLVWKRP
jgi:hypothetical protein